MASTAVIATALPASAYNLNSTRQPTDTSLLQWSIESDAPEICDDADVSLKQELESGDSQEVEDSSVVAINDSGVGGTIDMANLPAGAYILEIVCESENPDSKFDLHELDFNFARYVVTKNVEGDAPADAVFGFEVTAIPDDESGDLIPFEFDLAAGESKAFYDFDVTAWSVEETDDGGALEVRADNTEFTSIETEEFVATVTNVFPTSDPAPEPEDKPEPEDEKPAPSAKAKPNFTG